MPPGQAGPASGAPTTTPSQPQQASSSDDAASEPTTSIFGFLSRMALARTTSFSPQQVNSEDGEPHSEQEQMVAAERQLTAETASLGSDEESDDDDLSTGDSTPTGWVPAHPSRSASPVHDSSSDESTWTAQNKLAWTAQDKLAALQKEFGPARADVDSSERWLAETYGGPSSSGGLLIIGSIHVTTHRLLFYGQLPALDDLASCTTPGPIKTGAAYTQKVYTRLGVESTHRKRVWLELEADMVTSYRDSTERGRTEPLKVVRLSAIRRILKETLPLVIEFESTPLRSEVFLVRALADTHL